MALDSEAIRALLSSPSVRQPSGRDYPEGYEIWSDGRIAVVVVPDERVVVTFLWRGVVYQRGSDDEPFRD
jgi:hypothetical protein